MTFGGRSAVSLTSSSPSTHCMSSSNPSTTTLSPSTVNLQQTAPNCGVSQLQLRTSESLRGTCWMLFRAFWAVSSVLGRLGRCSGCLVLRREVQLTGCPSALAQRWKTIIVQRTRPARNFRGVDEIHTQISQEPLGNHGNP